MPHEQLDHAETTPPFANPLTLESDAESKIANLFRRDTTEDNRRAALNSLFFNSNKNWKNPFWLMLLLSVGIASLGLSENSAATVIGAMIVAPLGQPIVALGANIAIGAQTQVI